MVGAVAVNRPTRLYLVSVPALALVAFAFASATQTADWRVALFLGALTFVTEWAAFSIPIEGSVSLSFAIVYAAVLLGGPFSGAIVALFGAVPPQDFRNHKPPIVMAFNLGQVVLSALASGVVFGMAGGQPLAADSSSAVQLESWLLPAVLAALAYAVTNMTLVGKGISLVAGVELAEVWKTSFKSYTVSLVALTLLGIVLVQLVVVSGFLAVLLLVVPFGVARQTFQVYAQLSDAYRGTLRSLIAVIEAKDPYTRGHSERVATYARDIAEELGLSAMETQRIEYAALLHDIGKVGISVSTLLKNGSLSAQEFGEIKLHPLTGSRVLADIDFLSDIVPIIEAHHERLDGSGYPYAMSGKTIPLGAQILAVADTFDAMTSDRSYRPALEFQVAVEELGREAGVSLNQACVDALLRRVDAELVGGLASAGFDWGDAR